MRHNALFYEKHGRAEAKTWWQRGGLLLGAVVHRGAQGGDLLEWWSYSTAWLDDENLSDLLLRQCSFSYFGCVCIYTCLCICVCVWVYLPMCVDVEARGQHFLSLLLILLRFLKQRVSLSPARLAGVSAVWCHRPASACLAFTWVLGIQTQLLLLSRQTVYPLSGLPASLSWLTSRKVQD